MILKGYEHSQNITPTNTSAIATSSSCVRLQNYWDKKQEFVASVLIIFITDNNKGHKLKFVIPLFLEPDWVNL